MFFTKLYIKLSFTLSLADKVTIGTYNFTLSLADKVTIGTYVCYF